MIARIIYSSRVKLKAE